MKKNNIINSFWFKSIAFVSIAALGLGACNDDDIEKFEPDMRLVGKEKVEIRHNNPATGKPYTEEELKELNYDPTKEETYLADQDVELLLWTQAKPKKTDVLLVGEDGIFTTLENAVEFDGGYSMTLKTTLEELKIPSGLNKSLNFQITYDDLAVGDFGYASSSQINFLVNATQTGGPQLVSYRKSFKESMGLAFESIATEFGTDALAGKYVDLNGSSQYLTIKETEQNMDFTHSEDFSLSLWVNTTATESDPSIIGDKDWGGGSNKGFVMFFTGEKWKMNIGDGADGRVDLEGNKINDGKWHHLAVTFDRDGSMTMYQNGEQIGQTDISATTDMNSGMPIRIGQDGTGSYGDFFKGKIGSVVVSDYLLSKDEIKVMAGKGSGVQLRTKDAVSVIEVENGASENTIENGMPVGTYNGTDDFSTIKDEGKLDFRYENDWSVAVWVNTTSEESDPSIIGDKDWGSGGNPGFIMAYKGDVWKINVADADGNRKDVDGQAINDGEWHLLMATFDRDGELILYQDGKKVGSTSIAGAGSLASGLPMRLAQEGTGAYGDFFEGKIGRAMIFDYVVSADDALKLFAE
ncbi:MAG: LamG domain-containing protein [Carboxylicivirga sp.]|jgi:hypothetical protein|nr:LamG domain-containing protein [Carboxylicivirga sp.]